MKIRLLFFACFFLSLESIAQLEYPLGVSLNDDEYLKVPLQSQSLRGSLPTLESEFSIKQFCPKPLSQRRDLISPSMAAAYGALTMLEAKKRNISNDPLRISREISFSPVFNYFMAKPEDSEDCQTPVSLIEVLKSMKLYGTPLMQDFLTFCPQSVNEEVFNKAISHRISDFLRLFNLEDDSDDKIDKVKYSISQQLPVIINMHTPSSFFRAQEFWQPREKYSDDFPLHTLVVVGYDNNKYGGAFEVMNSWGTGWGNDGFVWIKYEDFAQYVRYAYELFVINGQNQDAIDLVGNISVPTFFPNEKDMPISTGRMEVSLIEPGYYKAVKEYPFNTHVKVKISALEKSFIYVFSSDLSEEFFALFPDPDDKVTLSPAMPFKKNIVELPKEGHYYLEDPNEATNYLCVVFSKEELWMRSIESEFHTLKGRAFQDKVQLIFGDHLVDPANIAFEFNDIKFSGKSKGKTVLPIILEVTQSKKDNSSN